MAEPDLPHLTEPEKNLLLAAWDRPSRRARVASAAELEGLILDGGGPALDLEPAYASLVARGWFVAEGDRWTLTELGIPVAQRLMQDAMREGFGTGLVRNARSATYVEYCRRVYGTDGFRFNMVDAPQLDRLLDVIELAPGQRFVDLGCAVGALTREIAEHTGAEGVGIDFAPPAIEFAQEVGGENVSFEVGDLNRLTLPAGSFDVALSIDTLYFVDDVSQAVQDICALLRPGGRFAAFYSVKREPDEPAADLEVGATLLARAFDHHGIPWSAVEFTEEAHALWKRARDATDALKDAWVAEGNLQTWTSRDGETARVLPRYEDGRARRYLYWAQVSPR